MPHAQSRRAVAPRPASLVFVRRLLIALIVPVGALALFWVAVGLLYGDLTAAAVLLLAAAAIGTFTVLAA